MYGNIEYIIGQILSIIAVIFGFICYQMKSSKGVLIFQIFASLVFSLHYLMIGAMTAMALNLLGAIKCAFYYARNKRADKSLVIPIFFTVLVVITSIMTWDDWYSAFIMTGLVINSITLSLSDIKKIRILTLIKSPLCLIYNILVLSSGGIIYECTTLGSVIIGIARDLTNKKKLTHTKSDC